MKPVVHILSHMTNDIVVRDAGTFQVFFSSYNNGEFTTLTSVTVDGDEVIDHEVAIPYQDHSLHIPVEGYAVSVPASRIVDGAEVKVTIEANNEDGLSSATSTIDVFPPYEYTIDISDEGQIAGALEAAASISASHIRLLFSGGTYRFPDSTHPSFTSFDLSSSDSKLVTIEARSGATVWCEDVETWIRNVRWIGIGFRPGTKSVAISVRRGSRQVFERCQFSGSVLGNVTGLSVDFDSYARVQTCLFSSLSHAVRGASIVRDCYWYNIGGVVFQDIQQSIEATLGFGLSQASDLDQSYWLLVSGGVFGGSIRYNMVVDIDSPIALLVEGVDGASIVGNVWNTRNTSGIDFGKKVVNSYMVHNTVRTSPTSGDSLLVASEILDSAILNNYFTRVKNNLPMSGDVYDYNATEASLNTHPGDNSLDNVKPRFANKYMLLTQNSPLRSRGKKQTGVTKAFGLLPLDQAIGAMPYHPDIMTSTVLSQIISHPEFGLSLTLSTDGDYDALEPALGFGGAWDFSDGTQSGHLLTI